MGISRTFRNYNLPAEQWLPLVCELAERKLIVLHEAGILKQVWVTDDQGNQSYTDEAQDIFNVEIDVVAGILGDHNVNDREQI